MGMALAGAVSPSLAGAETGGGDQAAIAHVIKSTWEAPERLIRVEPVVVQGEHAVAGWLQGERGGRALLRRSGGVWSVVLCSGDPLAEAAVLVTAGVPEADAALMADNLATAERALTPEHRAAFSRFEGLVDMRGHHQLSGHHK